MYPAVTFDEDVDVFARLVEGEDGDIFNMTMMVCDETQIE